MRGGDRGREGGWKGEGSLDCYGCLTTGREKQSPTHSFLTTAAKQEGQLIMVVPHSTPRCVLEGGIFSRDPALIVFRSNEGAVYDAKGKEDRTG